MRVYLAGPIAGQSTEQAGKWRDFVTTLLDQDSIDTVDPFKLRDFRNVPYPGDLAVVEPDKADIDSCDVLLANCPIISVGTTMEILYAWERDKFVLVVHPWPEHASPWITYHAHAVESQMAIALWEITDYKRMSTLERIARRKTRTVGPFPASSLVSLGGS
jgi:nucleoside 2-deoxyribosyltransferase